MTNINLTSLSSFVYKESDNNLNIRELLQLPEISNVKCGTCCRNPSLWVSFALIGEQFRKSMEGGRGTSLSPYFQGMKTGSCKKTVPLFWLFSCSRNSDNHPLEAKWVEASTAPRTCPSIVALWQRHSKYFPQVICVNLSSVVDSRTYFRRSETQGPEKYN